MRFGLKPISIAISISTSANNSCRNLFPRAIQSSLRHPSSIIHPTFSRVSHLHSNSITMAPKKRQPESNSDSEEIDEQESKPSSSSSNQPPNKKQKQSSTSTNATGNGNSSSETVSKKAPPHTEKAAAKGKGAPGAHPNQSDYNPNRGKLPKETPTQVLRDAMAKHQKSGKELEKKNGNVLYWMRMRDLRLEDNRALSNASQLAQKRGSNLIVLHLLSPADFKAHDTSARKIDFLLRNLKDVKSQFDALKIPLIVLTLASTGSRISIIDKVISICKETGSSSIFSNLEFEVNELWRDTALISKIEKENKDLDFNLFDDTYIVPPGMVVTKENKPYSVFSPWNKNWCNVIDQNMHLLDESPNPKANDESKLKADSKLQDYLKKNDEEIKIPDQLPGFECSDSDYMKRLWPSGHKSALKVLANFFHSASEGSKDDLEASADKQGKNESKDLDIKKTRVGKYGEGRNIMSCNGTSRLSPYLTMGVISPRHVCRETMKHTKKLNVGRDSGIAMFNTEIGFRDFYGHVLSAFPRVSMGKCYIPKYEDVVWNYSDSELQAWKDGKTGYPIVDASMRQMKAQGYMHNRGRMIVSMFLTKHLLHDWREGEVHFMQNLIDCDLASNNGGWQWSASTGTDPQPYFRIFNPLAQSEKSDPDGEYIRHWVPELSKVKGKAIHAPFDRLGKKEFEALGYPKPIVEHTFARKRALARFKNPGETADE